jgi:hypothetical protein
MDNKSVTIRVPRRWVRIAMIVGVTALVVAPLTAVASHSFTDVPDNQTFHEDIEWLKDTGVTRGCNPPANTEFCPDRFTSRGEMAAFMKRYAAFIDAEDGTPGQADNADTVDGFDASSLVRAEGSATDNPSESDGTVESVDIDAPVDGLLLVDSVADATDDDDDWFCRIDLNGTQVPELGYNIDPATGSVCANDMLLSVEAGEHTIDLVVGNIGTSLNETSLSVLFVPFDGNGDQPTTFTELGTGDPVED